MTQLPPNRQLKKLSEVVDIQSSNFLPNDNETYNYIGLENIESNTGNLIDYSPTVGKEIKSNKVKFEKGMILYGKLRPYLNKVHLAEFDGIATTEILPMKVKKGIDQKYLASFLKSKKFVDEANESVSGARMPRVTTRFLQEYDKIPLPPLPVQHKIVALLDIASAQITASKSAIQSQLDALDQLWQSSLSEVFEKGGGTSKTINDISHKIQYGYTGKTIKKGQFRYLRITDIQNDNVNWETVPFVEVSQEEAKKYELNTGDVVFARTGATVGKSFLINEVGKDKIFASYLIRVVSNYEHIKPEFLKYFFQSGIYWSQIFADVVGAAQPNFNGKKLGEIQIPLPNLATQTHIVSQLDDLSQNISSLKSQYTTQLQHFDDLRASILDQAFTGKLES